ncbi:hypothetical protein ACFUIY_12140 [Streptomyces griseorubiginosus]|uniref:hypothetical protein n=1 Tax=Streptomyces griseorubiginosus TaxID=67304 RepID=UPI00363A501A
MTCLACREHARAQHLRFADEIERIGTLPGSPVTSAEARRAAGRHRALAERFSSGSGD